MTLGLAGTKPSRKRLRAGESAVGSTGLRLGQGIGGLGGVFGFRVANEPLVEKRNGIDAASDPRVFNSLTDFNEGKLSLSCNLGESDALGTSFLRAKDRRFNNFPVSWAARYGSVIPLGQDFIEHDLHRLL